MGARWSTEHIPDLGRKVAIVTGANGGIGYHVALELGRKGATVILACRNRERGEKALEKLRSEAFNSRFALMLVDLSSLASIGRFVDEFKATYDRLDLLVNNAGMVAMPERSLSADGYELTLATNHLGPFALTGLLIDWLQRSDCPRIVMVSSLEAHRAPQQSEIDFKKANVIYNRAAVYAESKLANLLMAIELTRRYPSIITVAAHPGHGRTDLNEWASSPVLKYTWQSAKMAALPILRAATDPTVQLGDFYGPRSIFERRGYPTKVHVPRLVLNDDYARRYWEASENATGVHY